MRRMVIVGYVAGLALANGAPPVPDPDDDGPLPKTPTAFETRDTGAEQDEEAKFPAKKNKGPQKYKFTAVSETRDWRDTKGTIIRARLLAFEGGHQSASKKPLTLIKDGKVRLLVEGRKMFSELPVAQLSPKDQAFVKALDAARRKEFAEAKKHANTRSQTKQE